MFSKYRQKKYAEICKINESEIYIIINIDERSIQKYKELISVKYI